MLSKLYYGLGMGLNELSDAQCAQLAAGKNSLLIGVNEDGVADDGSPITTAEVCKENAQNALRSAVDIDPDNAQAEHMLAAMSADGDGAGDGAGSRLGRASPAFVKALFDDFSDSFDEKLTSLGYKVPKLIGDTVASYVRSRRRGEPFRTALDAGCGTGLAGPHLRPLSGSLIGADISPKCSRRPRLSSRGKRPGRVRRSQCCRPDRALGADVLPPAEASQGFELVTAADVLVYFGALHDLVASFGRVSSLLRPHSRASARHRRRRR